MSGFIQSGRFGVPAFSPLNVAWSHAYWAAGPEFAALGTADGAVVGTWPDEVGTADLTAAGASRPTYRSAYANLNSKPAIQADGANRMATSNFSAIGMPFTFAAVLQGFDRSGGSTNGEIAASLNGADTVLAAYAASWDTRWGISASVGLWGTNVSGDTHLFLAEFNGASSKIILDGTTIATGTTGTGTADKLTAFGIASTTGYGVTGAIPFIGIAPSVLSAEDKASLLAWSQSTYATP